MDVYLEKQVQKWADKSGVTDEALMEAAIEISNGIAEVDHGAGVFKKRIASEEGQGKSGGSRVLVAWNHGDRVVYMFGFRKAHKDSVSEDALKEFKKLSKNWKAATDKQMKEAVKNGQLRQL